MFRGSRDALRATLAREYRAIVGRVPNAAALGDALNVLAGEAMNAEPEPVHLRIAAHDDNTVLDLGTPDGRAVVISADGWDMVERSPVLFRRTALTGAMPEPERGGSLDDLRDLLNVADADWALVMGWLIAAFVPAIEHPIIMFGGQQDSGKTTAARFLAGLVDDSPVPTRCAPRDIQEWAVSASGSWVVTLDNLSNIAPWFSDALCRACTGEGMVRRRLYFDSDLAVLNFRRVVILTSIDAGALRGDLGRRLLLIDLEPIGADRKRGAADLAGLYAERRPAIFGALLDLLARVLKIMPTIEPPATRGLADFARLLATLDRVMGSDSRGRYESQFDRIAEAVIDSDPVAVAVLAFVRERGAWSGTALDLLTAITPERPPRGWPASPRALAGRLRRLIPALCAVGLVVTFGREPGGERRRLLGLRYESSGARPSQPSRPSRNPRSGCVSGDSPGTVGGTVGDGRGVNRPADRPAKIGPGGSAGPIRDGRDDRDGEIHTLSGGDAPGPDAGEWGDL